MLLRRITKHVKTQNWFAVFVDFVIVVIGVFIGIQVSNWNEARTESEQEREILLNIMDDIRNDAKELSGGVEMAEINITAGNYALAKAGFEPITSFELATQNANIPVSIITPPAPADLSAEQTQRLWSDIAIRYHPNQSDAAFDTLLSTGRLGLIKNRELVRLLQNYHQNWYDIETSQNTTFRPFRNQMVFAGQRQGLGLFTRMSEDEFVAILKSDKELLGTMRTMLALSLLHRELLKETLNQANNLIIQLEEATN